MSPVEPVNQFLGATVDPGNPRSVLGLPEGAICTPERVSAAAGERLELIDGHVLSRTPEADDARLAVHLAAAGLAYDAGKAARVVPERAVEARGAVAPGVVTSGGGVFRGAGRVVWRDARAAARVRELARVAVALSGGWGPRALSRLVALAAAEGVRPNEIPAMLAPLTVPGMGPVMRSAMVSAGGDRGSGSGAVPGGALRLVRGGERDDVSLVLDRLRPVAAGLAVALPLVGLTAVLIVMLSRANTHRLGERGAAAQAGDVAASAAAEGVVRVLPAVRAEDLPAREPTSAGLVARELALAAQLPESQRAEAIERAAEAASAAAGMWLEIAVADRDELRVALRAFSDRAGAELTIAVVEAVHAGPGGGHAADPGTVIARADVVAELERAGPGRARGMLVDVAREAGAGDGAGGDAGTGTRSAAWWGSWARAAGALTGAATAERSLAVIAAMEAILTGGVPEERAVGRVVGLAPWREGSVERRWLIGALGSARFESAGLSAVTEALAGTGAPGVDATMTLGPGADAAARKVLAQRLAEAWGMGVPGRETFVEEWNGVAEAALARAGVRSGAAGGGRGDGEAAELAALADAAALSWLSAAMAQHERGEHDRAAASIERARQTARPVIDAGDGALEEPARVASSWLAEYRSQTEASRRVRMLEVAGADHPLSVPEGREILSEAFRGSPREVRAAALGAAERLAPTAALAWGLLDELDRLPSGAQLVGLVTLVTGRVIAGADAREVEARMRAALVEHVLLGRSERMVVLDELARSVVEALEAEAGRGGAGGGGVEAAERLLARAGVTGPVMARSASSAHRAAAGLRKLAEAEAAGLAARRAGFGAACAGVLREMEARWAGAGHVHEQLAAACAARVKMVRLDVLEPEL